MDSSKDFEPKRTIAWLIGNENYSNVRTAPADKEPKPDYADLTQVPKDIETMSSFFTELKFDGIVKTQNATKKEMELDFRQIRNKLEEADKDPKDSTLLYVYYSGHGVILKGTTHIVLNEEET